MSGDLRPPYAEPPPRPPYAGWSALLAVPGRLADWLARDEITTRSTLSDVVFGVVLPWVLLVLDRTVVADEIGKFAGGVPVTPYVVLLTLAGQAALLTWLLGRHRPGWWLLPLSGALFVAMLWAAAMSLVAFAGGLLLGLNTLVSALSVPAAVLALAAPLTALTYVRATAGAVVAARPYAQRETRVAWLLLSALLLLSACYLAGRAVKALAARAEQVVLEGPTEEARARAARRLRRLWVFPGVRPWRLWDAARRGDRPPGHTERARAALTVVHAVPRDEIDRRLPGWD